MGSKIFLDFYMIYLNVEKPDKDPTLAQSGINVQVLLCFCLFSKTYTHEMTYSEWSALLWLAVDLSEKCTCVLFTVGF